MAKRRKLEMPSTEDLNRIEAELGQGGAVRPTAPIAQVAAESAGMLDSRSAETRAQAARDAADAEALRSAQGRGLVMLELPIDQIDADALVRDRVVLDAEEMKELQRSISQNGLRLPIEVFTRAGEGYGLLSGYRRLKAVRDLHAMTQAPAFATIKAVVRDPEAMGGAFAAMIEENEIRASLSHFERGRIAVIASQQGTFDSVESAVDVLFPMASKAKRSKIRSFALIFEELGDLLRFPDLIKEKDGLKLAAALRDGAETKLRDALDIGAPGTVEEEAAILADVLARLDVTANPARGGRPKKTTGVRLGQSVTLEDGTVLQAVEDGQGFAIRVKGVDVDLGRIESLLIKLN